MNFKYKTQGSRKSLLKVMIAYRYLRQRKIECLFWRKDRIINHITHIIDKTISIRLKLKEDFNRNI